MMNAIFKRRSVRDFLPAPVEKEKIERILRAAFEAPSAHNRRPWEFLVVTGKEKKEAIAGMSPWAKMCPSAAAVIACCADLKKGDPGYETGGDPEDALWEQDLAASVENALLQITEEGLGGVWLGWYPGKARVNAFSEYFHLPAHIVPVALIALGYPAKESSPRDRYDPQKVHWESWEP
ncbi:MAG: nitroreductase family protein [Treponema sp.]|jgi:nitroreductase|nr:nitroreductase family protein [Treponema sp.]